MRQRASGRRLAFGSEAGGNITTMGALVAPVLFAAAAFAVDEGALYHERREAQRIADLAAIAASANIGNAEETALATFADNGLPNVVLVERKPASEFELNSIPGGSWLLVETGTYRADSGAGVASRFTAGAPEPNAVRLTFGKKGKRYFASSLIAAPRMSAQSIASADRRAAFSVGSRLAALDGGVLNAILGGLTGSSLSLSVMDYEALLDADVDLLGFFDALATELDIAAGSYDDVLAAQASIGDIAAALATAGADERAVAAMALIADAAAADITLPLSRIIDLGPAGSLAIGRGSGLALAAGMMEILTAAASVADGRRQAAIELGVAAPGLAGLTLRLAIAEPPQSSPWLAVGAQGDVVRTAQTRLLLDARIGGGGALSGIAINLPLYLELAYAEAELARVNCPPAARGVTVNVRPGVADLRIASIDTDDLADFGRSPVEGVAQIVKAGVIDVRGEAYVRIGNATWTPLAFTASDISNAEVKTASTSSFAGSLTRSLADDLDLDVSIAGLDLGLSALVKTALRTGLTAAAPALDQAVGNVLAALGLRLGEADIRVHGLVCRRAVLVQ